jgi:CzcA family heavy metal efflux pump
MLGRIVRWSLDHPRLIAWACVGFLIWGALSLRDSSFELIPELAPARTTIHTEAPGLVAEQIETLVTHPIEAAILGAPGVARVSSESVQGLSIVTVDFAPRADPARVREAVSERLGPLGGRLPAGVAAPRLDPLISVGGRVLRIGFTSVKATFDDEAAMALRDEIDWTVRPRLLAVAGVGRVAVYGGLIRRLEVRARPADLSDSDLGFLDILNAVKRATSVTGAGFIDTDAQRVLIEPRGQALSKEDVGAGQIQTPGGAPVRIEDVSDVSEAPAPAFGDALVMGRPGVVVDVAKQYGHNTLATTHAVEAELAVLAPDLRAKGMAARVLDRPATYDTAIVRSIAVDLAVGAVLIAVTLAILMRDLRATAISLIAIPLSLIAAVLLLKACGFSLNAMTIGGLALGLGVVIDDAVIDVENILNDLREAETHDGSRLEAVWAASLEVRAPVIYATLATVVALVPVLALPGRDGALLAPLAAALILSGAASLIVALVVTPALSFYFLRHVGRASHRNVLHGIHDRHEAILSRTGGRAWPLIIVSAAVVIVAALSLLFARPGPLPTADDGQLRIAVAEPAGTSLGVSRRYGEAAAAALLPMSGVRTVSERIGRDAEGDDSAGPERGVIELTLAPGDVAARRRIAAEAGRRVAALTGLNPSVTDLEAETTDNLGETDPIRVRVFSETLDDLDSTAARVAAALRELPGAGSVQDQAAASTPVVRADVNFQRLALYGLSSADVLDTVQAAFASESVGKIYVGDRVVDLAVSAQQTLRQDPEGVGDLLLRSSSGISVPLKAVADVYLTDDRAMIDHEGGLRSRLVAATPKDPGRFVAAAREAIAKLRPPPGTHVTFESAQRGASAATNSLLTNYAVALLAIYAVLAMAFDGRTAIVILVSSLFALVGAALAVAMMGGVLSLGALFGLVALFGLSLRGAILIFGELEALIVEKDAPWRLETVTAATRERLTPIVTTTLLVALALAPLAIHLGDSGREVLGPMAVTIILGLITSALGQIFVLPTLIFAFWRPAFAYRSGKASNQASTSRG